MGHLARRHPIIATLLVLMFAPYIAAALLLGLAVFAVAVTLDLLMGRKW